MFLKDIVNLGMFLKLHIVNLGMFLKLQEIAATIDKKHATLINYRTAASFFLKLRSKRVLEI